MTARARGFSLIELLVALAVFALVVVALLNLGGGSARTAMQLETRMLAGIVADTLAAEAQLETAAGPAEGSERLGDRTWRWTRGIEPAGGGLARVRIAVFADDGQQVASAEVLR
ncbi:type II secretion system minor pseudopilin GspI [Luteimonas deserti]|uniref:Type II secretion system protein I n=1 Tax=Luteimonas deserti TaxID=2752306 RepID=A0A7Z0TVI8_9GAMM|nr:type II secretion system minor pseudopilin GspI [Luteimonas deserti]NYZ63906.1 type II secretion system minor pseudopilin GspI [Luteimonas deserti]